MNIDPSLIDLVSNFREVMEAREGHLKCFHEHGVQLEGWLKGEFMHFLDQYKIGAKIVNFDREEPVGRERRKVDFRIDFLGKTGTLSAWLEIKHWLVGYQKGCKYDALFYFRDSSSVGIAQDVRKLVNILGQDQYLLILTTENPGENQWLDGIAEFNKKFSPLVLTTLNNPKDFPDYYFLGLLKIA